MATPIEYQDSMSNRPSLYSRRPSIYATFTLARLVHSFRDLLQSRVKTHHVLQSYNEKASENLSSFNIRDNFATSAHSSWYAVAEPHECAY